MRTSLTDIKLAEQYLAGKLSNEDALVFEARLLTSPLLRVNVFVQKRCYALLRMYHKRKAIVQAHEQLFADPERAEWQQHIHGLFKK
jgi:hypothetical protein